MGRAVIRTVVDPANGEEMQIMAFENAGKIRYQRLASFEERMTPRGYDNLARFGEAASKAFGRKATRGHPPVWDVVREEIPKHELTLPGRKEVQEAKQQRYAEMLGNALPDVQAEVIRRRSFLLPTVASPRVYRIATLQDTERRLRERMATASAPYLR
jgi:hypothetical protein